MKHFIRLSCLGLALIAGRTARADLVNGDFATGNFAGWTLSENDPYTDVSVWSDDYLGVSGSPDATYFDLSGPYEVPLSLSQSFATIAGDTYEFSFDLAHSDYSGDAGAEFSASFGSDTVLNLVGGDESLILGQWQIESFTAVATSSTTTITFTDRSDAGYYLLANIDPDPLGPANPAGAGVPDQSVGLTLITAILFSLCVVSSRNFRRRFV